MSPYTLNWYRCWRRALGNTIWDGSGWQMAASEVTIWRRQRDRIERYLPGGTLQYLRHVGEECIGWLVSKHDIAAVETRCQLQVKHLAKFVTANRYVKKHRWKSVYRFAESSIYHWLRWRWENLSYWLIRKKILHYCYHYTIWCKFFE